MRPQRNNARRSAARDAYRQRVAAYMNSEQWTVQREKWVREFHARHRTAPSCAVCAAPWKASPSSVSLDVHHHTYERLGTETFEDLTALCRDHHEAVHRAFDTDSYWRRIPREAASVELIRRLKEAGSHV